MVHDEGLGNDFTRVFPPGPATHPGATINTASIPENVHAMGQKWTNEDITRAIRESKMKKTWKYLENDEKALFPESEFPGSGGLRTAGLQKPNAKGASTVRVVYKGNDFVGLLDVSNSKPERIRDFCKRGAEPCPAKDTDDTLEDTDNTLEDTDNTLEDTHDTLKDTHGFLEDTHGSLKVQPDEADSPATEEKLLQLADGFAESEFASLAAKFGLADLMNRQGKMSLSQMRARFKSHLPLLGKSWATSLRLNAKGSIAGIATALPLVIKQAYDVFSDNSTTTLERVAVLTSLLPIASCTLKAAANRKQGVRTPISTGLCYVGDILLFTPLAPLGLLLRSFGSLVETYEHQSWKNTKSTRDKWWQEDNYPKILRYFESKEFASSVESRFTTEMAAVLFAGAETKGMLIATKATIHGNSSNWERRQMQTTLDKQQEETLPIMCDVILDTKDRFVKDYPRRMVDWVHNATEAYNEEFIDRYRSNRARFFRKHAPRGHEKELRRQFDEGVNNIVKKLRSHPVPKPEDDDIVRRNANESERRKNGNSKMGRKRGKLQNAECVVEKNENSKNGGNEMENENTIENGEKHEGFLEEHDLDEERNEGENGGLKLEHGLKENMGG
ncbi:hypothetical protein OCS_02401 [Ophiocordyceps sinensis CO18]|uniref:Uncharacterized protein n=1 Tax=Ophiocordyceps sinensis (strain Co18 / CGMCC 3.14243) TaxID=911162 RepID=T5AJD8_OPHSC|nr:hypothetical protein OCS_02401 [Ophiocordyceps sinensis CO18]